MNPGSPIRILQVFTILNRGGAETMVMNLYRHIDRSLVQFDFLVCRPEHGAYEREIESLGGKIFRIPSLFQLNAHRQAVRDFFRDHQDYRVIHGHVGELGFFIYKEARLTGVPCIIAHAHSSFCDKDWKLPIRYVLKHLIRKQATRFMACGAKAARWYFGNAIAEHTLQVKNAIAAKNYCFSQEAYDSVRAEMGWENHWIIGNVARFSPVKNHVFLIHLFDEIIKQCPNALLVLVGETKGPVYEQVHHQVQRRGLAKHVQFLGSRDDVARLLKGMDVFVFPSLYEGFGIAMLEAEASGLHVVKSDMVENDGVVIPDLVTTLTLSAPIQQWVKTILTPYQRRDTFEDICRAGFDIQENARWLQQFYLDQAGQKR